MALSTEPSQFLSPWDSCKESLFNKETCECKRAQICSIYFWGHAQKALAFSCTGKKYSANAEYYKTSSMCFGQSDDFHQTSFYCLTWGMSDRYTIITVPIDHFSGLCFVYLQQRRYQQRAESPRMFLTCIVNSTAPKYIITIMIKVIADKSSLMMWQRKKETISFCGVADYPSSEWPCWKRHLGFSRTGKNDFTSCLSQMATGHPCFTMALCSEFCTLCK